MRYYFVINFNHYGELILAADRSTAIEQVNDKARNAGARADVCYEALPCPHPNRYFVPELPGWMLELTNIAPGCKVCSKCMEPKDEVVPEPAGTLFHHLKMPV